MLHIILTILKILGITLLAILGLIIFLLLVVLFVPIRYDIKASKHEKVYANIKVHWILHIITARFLLDGGKDFCIKVFGIKIYPKKPKTAAAENVKSESETSDENTSFSENDNVLDKEQHEIASNDKEAISTDSRSISSGSENLPTDNRDAPSGIENSENADSDNAKKPKKSIGTVIREKAAGIKNRLEDIKNRIIDIIGRIKSLFTNIGEKAGHFADMLKDESNRKSIKYLWECVKDLLKALMPKKHKIYVLYGKEDPAKLADIIGYVAVLKAYTNVNLEFVPDFTKDVFEADARLKGKIRLFFVCLLAYRVYKNKDVRRFLNNFTK